MNTAAEDLEIQIEQDRYALVPGVLSSTEVEQLVGTLTQLERASSVRQQGNDTYAVRNLLQAVPEIAQLAKSDTVLSLVRPILGSRAFPARGLLFDKTPGANWKVAWHQDLTIAVKERRDIEGFGPWSIKAGVIHVQPPTVILERMLTVRLHLDDCTEHNGPLQVLPGSHKLGRLKAEQIGDFRKSVSPITCTMTPGGALLMRPLLLHASSPAATPAHRRVIHLEFAAELLPDGRQWITM